MTSGAFWNWMKKLPPSRMRKGVELKAHDRLVPFSFFPTSDTGRRKPVQSLLFAIDPWLIMRRAVADKVANNASQREALSYLDQAEDFFRSASSSHIGAAKPLQLYYSYLNLVKSFALCRGQQASLPNVQHGVAESVAAGGSEFSDAQLTFFTSPNSRGQFQAFDEFIQALNVPRLTNSHVVPVKALVPQILPGHRLWATATGKRERFISVQRVGFYENKATKKVWLRVYLFADDVRRLGHTHADVLALSGLSNDFKKVSCSEEVAGRKLICFEQRNPVAYVRHGVDHAIELADMVREHLWATVASTPPYRRYYVYLCPNSELPHRLHQLGSIYALTYYLGSITRYRPTVYKDILDGDFGPRVSEFVAGQSAQFVYLIASEFVRRDVTRPSIV